MGQPYDDGGGGERPLAHCGCAGSHVPLNSEGGERLPGFLFTRSLSPPTAPVGEGRSVLEPARCASVGETDSSVSSLCSRHTSVASL